MSSIFSHNKREEMTSVGTGGHRAEEQPVEAGRPGGETEGTGEGRHSGHSPEAHPNPPAWVTRAEKSRQAVKPSTVRGPAIRVRTESRQSRGKERNGLG